MTTRIVHLSDLHIGPMTGFAPRHWNVKRALGYINWQRRRRHVHQPQVIARLVADIVEQKPDHWVLTGDLVNIGLPAEYERAAAWLATIGPPETVSVVPGNHDIYTRLWTDEGCRRWQDYMTSDNWGRGLTPGLTPGMQEFPYVRAVGELSIIGLNSAVPTPPGIASGLLGWRQCRDLERILQAPELADRFRLVLLHHPPLTGLADAFRRLRDANEFEAILAAAGAELVLFGHNHRNTLSWFERGPRPIPVIGIGSGSSAREWHGEGLGCYNLYDISRRPGGWRVEVVRRALSNGGQSVVEADRQTLEI